MLRTPTAIDLFCGAGGLSCGLEQAGFDVLGGFDADPVAHATFVANHGPAQGVRGPTDATSLSAADVWTLIGRSPGELEVVAGGPPCQGFSMAGHRASQDVRNTLVFHFARLIAELRPRFFVMENVVGLMSMRTPGGQRVLEALVEELEGAGYRTNVPGDASRWGRLVVNAADYGVPQRRRRVLVFGARDAADPLPALGSPTHHDPDCLPLGSSSRPHVTVADALDDLPAPCADEPLRLSRPATLSDYARAMRHPEDLLWNHVPTRHRPGMPERMAAQAPGQPLYDTWAHAWVRLVAGEPSPTVKENHNAPFVHHVQPRILTPRECARLQSFPDRFRFGGTKSRQLVQVGNAVPPLLGKAIGEAFLAALSPARDAGKAQPARTAASRASRQR